MGYFTGLMGYNTVFCVTMLQCNRIKYLYGLYYAAYRV